MIVVPQTGGFWLILPSSLTQTVYNRLNMYVLRSVVKLNTLDIKVMGLMSNKAPLPDLDLPINDFAITNHDSCCLLKIPSAREARYLLLNRDATNTTLKAELSADSWRFEDITAGLPWFDAEQSECYTPHMLNLDQLGGISLDKGCYTGQEIIARTHYLGKNKRHLYAGQIDGHITIHAGQDVVDPETLQILGQVLFTQSDSHLTRLLMVLKLETEDFGAFAIQTPDLRVIEILHTGASA